MYYNMKLRTCKRNVAALVNRARKGLLHACTAAADELRDVLRMRAMLRARVGNARHHPSAGKNRQDTHLLDAM